MGTKIITSAELHLAIDCLKQGEPIVFPTETVYGIGVPLFHEEGMRKIYALKNRPLDKPLMAHIASLESVREFAEGFDTSFYTLADLFWPGPLTIILRKKGADGTIAMRMPAHPIARRLIEGIGQPLAGTSANLSGKPAATDVQSAIIDLDVQYAIDGGACEVGAPSTIISLVDEPKILRAGKITRKMLEESLKCCICTKES